VRWEPLETAPRTGEQILLVGTLTPWAGAQIADNQIHIGYFDPIDFSWVIRSARLEADYEPNHWMPLPEFPA
jgi:hypothetical protein